MARPFVESAGATFPTVVDRNNLLSRIYGFKAIPNALFIDEAGSIQYLKYSGFDIIKPEFRKTAAAWATNGKAPTSGFACTRPTSPTRKAAIARPYASSTEA